VHGKMLWHYHMLEGLVVSCEAAGHDEDHLTSGSWSRVTIRIEETHG
jgi:hypothetical protein